VGKFGLMRMSCGAPAGPGRPDVAQEAVAVLLQLQYKSSEAKTMVDQAMEHVPTAATAEEVLNEVYRQRSAARPAARRGVTLVGLVGIVAMAGIGVSLVRPAMGLPQALHGPGIEEATPPASH